MSLIFKILTKKFALGWLILFAILFLAYPSYLAYSVKEGEKSKSYSMVKYLEQTNETVYLNVGIQVVETKSNNTSIPWTKIGIPLTEKKAIIILNYQAKLGVKKPVKVKKINENRYSVTIPKYDVIGIELDQKVPYQLYDASGDLLSLSTEDIDTGKLVTNRLSTKKQEMYLAKYNEQMNESAKSYYKTLFQGIDKDAKLEFQFDK